MLRSLGLALLVGAWMAISLPSLAQGGDPPPPVDLAGPVLSHLSAPGVFELKVTTRVTRPLPQSVPTVPIVHSYLRFVNALTINALVETSLFDSLYEVDMNHDGMLDQITVFNRPEGLRIDQLLVEPLAAGERAPERVNRADGSLKRYMLDPDGPEFMVLFNTPPVMGMELQHHGFRPTAKDFPNPCLQIMMFEPCAGPENPFDLPGEPQFKVNFPGSDGQDPPDSHLMFSWEPWLFERIDETPQWLRLVWVAVPLKNQVGTQDTIFSVDCNGDTNPVGLLVQVNYAEESGVRCRTTPQIFKVWPGEGRPQRPPAQSSSTR